ncbi:uncharacterized protein B0J16DRAFT_316594 [Fusarium flagelliforme]|uniref:uncharacterized protein n=1 Tax=Fusarium flagelliforme TaxID=2675880 RepID=UPI001E8D7217|nr:uncharacterized protein B0J16DRAFT_316594 [Fusarium flagelliforme]KAH7192913.1 hypothetical protein B0J16DRAFT_316594 [Fusarium flagelliforme]
MRNQLQPLVSHIFSLDHFIRRSSAHYFLKLMSRTYFPTQICVTPRNDGYNSLPQRTYTVTFDRWVSVACHGCRRRKVKVHPLVNDKNGSPLKHCSATIADQNAHPVPPRIKNAASPSRDWYEASTLKKCHTLDRDTSIRGAESIDEFLDSVHEAALLMPLSRSNERNNSNELNPNKNGREINSRRDTSGVLDDTGQGRRNED